MCKYLNENVLQYKVQELGKYIQVQVLRQFPIEQNFIYDLKI